jgi:hypothetical protein
MPLTDAFVLALFVICITVLICAFILQNVLCLLGLVLVIPICITFCSCYYPTYLEEDEDDEDEEYT